MLIVGRRSGLQPNAVQPGRPNEIPMPKTGVPKARVTRRFVDRSKRLPFA